MGQELINPSFEEWVRYLFDHPVTDPAWYWDINRERWNERDSSALALNYLTQLFENAGTILAPYSDAQVNQGLWYISFNGASDYFRSLHNLAVPIQKRLQCIESMYSLFEQVFFVRCSPHLSHVLHSDEPYPQGYTVINLACYMCWDNASTIYTNAIIEDYLEHYSRTMLDVLSRILELDSIACQESALHGLGHYKSFSRHFPDEITKYDVISIISKWLKTHKNIPNQLKNYALEARFGNVR
jgi:hypothetical protein